MNRKRIGASSMAIAALLTLPATVAQAGSPVTVLDLRLNEQAGASTAFDSSGKGHHGAVGAHVAMNGSYARFDYHSPSSGAAYGYEHLIKIPDASDGSLDPGGGNFSVELRYRTTHSFGNVIQKGQATTAGGQVKFQQPKGKMTCMFKTPQGRATAGSGATPLNDGNWHTVRCDRTPTSVTMYVDGVRTGRSNNTTGTLNNTNPWVLGGKDKCNGDTVTCDYFAGDIDYVKMTKS